MFELAAQANREKDGRITAQMKALGAVLGIAQGDPAVYFQSPTRYSRRAIEENTQRSGDSAPASSQMMAEEQIEALIAQRIEAKKNRDFAQADQIRATLKEAGVELDDKPGGLTQWRRA